MILRTSLLAAKGTGEAFMRDVEDAVPYNAVYGGLYNPRDPSHTFRVTYQIAVYC